ncbi:MAG: hypothetical protein AAF869_12360, partial [Pseudomonadota bacterium]
MNLSLPNPRDDVVIGNAVKGRSLWDDALARLVANKAAVASLVVLGGLALAAIVGPWLTAYDFDEVNYAVAGGTGPNA